jgi:AcrR family transcriptional regulator
MVLLATDDPVADPERVRILDAAERLFYARGLQQVGMDRVRAEATVSLKRLYREFPSKDQLIEAYLLRRDACWLNSLRAAVAGPGNPAERVLVAFDWLGAWFAEPGFRGCAFTNSFGELGADSDTVARVAAAHKAEFRGVFVGLVSELAAEHPACAIGPELGEQLYLLAEGAITAAGVTGDAGTACTARAAALTLLGAALERTAPNDRATDEPAEPEPSGRQSNAATQIGNRVAGLIPFRRLLRRR